MNAKAIEFFEYHVNQSVYSFLNHRRQFYAQVFNVLGFNAQYDSFGDLIKDLT
jgi:hypothetical protein